MESVADEAFDQALPRVLQRAKDLGGRGFDACIGVGRYYGTDETDLMFRLLDVAWSSGLYRLRVPTTIMLRMSG